MKDIGKFAAFVFLATVITVISMFVVGVVIS